MPGTNYPTALDTTSSLRTVTDAVDDVLASDQNYPRDAIIAAETKLGYGADTPTVGEFLVGDTAAGTSQWRVIAAADLPVTFTNINDLQFDTTPTVGTFVEGKMYYDATNKTISAMIDTDVTLQLGQEEHILAYNDTGSPIANGKLVRFTGANGDTPTIALSKADSKTTASVEGMTTQVIASGASGLVTKSGKVHDLVTTGLTAGSQLYLSPTSAGDWTETQPTSASHVSVKIGHTLVVDASVGSIYVNLSENNRLTDLDDVDITGIADGDALIYEAGSSTWKNSAAFTNHVASTANPHSTSDANLVTSNITTNNVSVAKHGFAPILSGNALQFLDGAGNWTTPTAGVANSYSLTTFVAQTSVNVVHNFGTYPNVQVVDGSGVVLIPLTITNNTVNDFTVTFDASTSGSLIATVGSPQPQALTSVSGDYTVLTTDRIIKETGAAKTITLPTAVGNSGREYIINNASAGNLTVDTTSSQTINGVLTQLVPSQSSMTVYSDGSNYQII